MKNSSQQDHVTNPGKLSLIIVLCVAAIVLFLVVKSKDSSAGSGANANTPAQPAAEEQVHMTLEEYLGRENEMWFLTGKKAYSIQAMMVSKETRFHNELEVTDYTVTDDGETVILKGKFGEMWATGLSKVIATYTKPDGSALSKEDFASKDRYIDITAKPDPDSYFAMYVPSDVSVTVETAGGSVLHTNLSNAPHGDGDYLVCRVNEDGEPDLADVWILNGLVFPEYYDVSNRAE